MREMARFTHDMTFFHHDVRGKRFNAHEGSHKMEMIISKRPRGREAPAGVRPLEAWPPMALWRALKKRAV